MDRIWQWAWDRYGSRYSWALWAIVFQFLLLIYLVPSFVVVTFEKSDRSLDEEPSDGLLATLLLGSGHVRIRLLGRSRPGAAHPPASTGPT